MGKKLNLDEKFVISEYTKGKSSLVISKEMGVSKPTILKILKKNNVTKKRDRCSKLDIKSENGIYYIVRTCPSCNKEIKTKSKDSVIACRNHLDKLKGSSLCKPCSLKLQQGEGNPFYGKSHTKKSKTKISNNRKGKATGDKNSMSNHKHREKARLNLKKKWDSGELEHVRKFMSNKLKETRRLGKIKSVIRSKKEKEIVKILKDKKFLVIHSFKIDTKICDIFLPKFNLIIEFNGDYWHCNPKKYKSDYYNKVKGLTAKEIWEYDKNKIDLILTKGYNLEIIWESEYKRNPNIINKIIQKYDTGE